MQPREGTVPELHVQPGECRLVSHPAILHTVLGSCVGVTFFVPRLGIGALCHPMLPHYRPNRSTGILQANRLRYVDFAIRDIARQFDSLGIERSEAQVKLFGGCDVLPVTPGVSRPTVGKLNSETAVRVLAEERFVLTASRLGGDAGFNIRFRTDTGEVLLRELSRITASESLPAPRGDRPPEHSRQETTR
jgi:chemotaxis protein CheD